MTINDQGRTALQALAIWAAVSLIEALVMRVEAGGSFLRALFFRGADYGVLGIPRIAVWFLSRRWTRSGWSWWRFGIAHLVLAASVMVLWQLGNAAVLHLCGGKAAVRNLFQNGLWIWLQAGLVYALLVSSILYAQARRRLRRQAERAAQLQLLAREAEVRALRAQLRPHFLFNVLNSIYALIGSEPDKAEKMVALLADLLRDTLELGDQDLVSLDEELALKTASEIWSSINLVNLRENIAHVDESIRGALIPPFLLQPVVENAVEHGIAPSAKAGRLEIAARGTEQGKVVEVRVRDTGPGPRAQRDEEARGAGRGLAITRNRLEVVYDQAASLTIKEGKDGGCVVVIRFPAWPTSDSIGAP